MSEKSYWDSFTRSRVSRRVLLRGAAATGIGATALSLIGCGGSSDDNKPAKESSGLISSPQDTTSKATRGGIMPSMTNTDTPSFQVYPSSAVAVTSANGRAYTKLFEMTLANKSKGEDPLTTVEGDAFASFEISPEGLTITGKLRPELTFDPRPPTNGRKLTTEDVRYSWEKIRTLGKS